MVVPVLDVLARFRTGRFLARAIDRIPSSAQPLSATRRTASLILLDEMVARVDSLTGLPGMDVRTGPVPNAPVLRLPLGRASVFFAHPSGVLYGGQDAAGIIELDPALDTARTVRTVTRPAPVTEEMIQRFQAMVDEGADTPPGAWGTLWAGEFADTAPAFGYLLAGRDGRVWVQDPARPNHHPLVLDRIR